MPDAAPPGEGGSKKSPADGATRHSRGEGNTRIPSGEGGSKRPPREGGVRKPRRRPAHVPCRDGEGRCQKLLRVYTRAARRWLGAALAVTKTPWVRRAGVISASALAVVLLVGGGLYWRLSSGPISLDIITPWLAKAIAENVGNQFQIEVGGTVLERDEHGRAAIRIRDIRVRDRDGALIAQRAEGRGRAVEREPIQRHAACRTPQSRRRRARDPGRSRWPGVGVDRRSPRPARDHGVARGGRAIGAGYPGASRFAQW